MVWGGSDTELLLPTPVKSGQLPQPPNPATSINLWQCTWHSANQGSDPEPQMSKVFTGVPLEFLWLIDCSHDGSQSGSPVPQEPRCPPWIMWTLFLALASLTVRCGQLHPKQRRFYQVWRCLPELILPPKPGQSPDNSVGKTTVYRAIRTHIKLSQKTLSYRRVKLSKTTVIMSERLGTKLKGLQLTESSKNKAVVAEIPKTCHNP